MGGQNRVLNARRGLQILLNLL